MAKSKRAELLKQKRRREKKAKKQIEEWVDKKRDEYRSEWNVNAEFFNSIGAYDWMCEAVVGKKLLIEIGCGTGESTLALAKHKHRIVTIEENPHCCRATAKKLFENGVDVELIERGEIHGTQNKSYKQLYQPLSLTKLTASVTVVEGDALFDNGLKEWLESIGPFDAVVCWLMGTNQSRQLVAEYSTLPWKDNGEYRLRVQNRVYELADRVLDSGGILNTVDRGELPEGDMKDELIKEDIDSHVDQASVTSLEIDASSQRYMKYEPTKLVGGKAMEFTPGTSGRMPKSFQIALRSISAIKP